MHAKMTATKMVFSDWFCTALHKRWWKAEWIAGDTNIGLKCERCGRVY